ncbi:uncharacterized protein LOC133185109 [Saccostrea echinata]|uniref:uncharacterized protein LOC133185109 n=1 Tax=Saccostrea echinata TaxID=191078 RepID=UPI002A80D6FF|nr:uncharacterized protein LOC133185109 [Saccostrea echinata]
MSFPITVTSQYLHYDCYGSGLMDANCSDTQQIYPVGVKVGTKEATLNCSKEYTPELNWTMIEFDRCCKPDPGDLCVGDYVNVGNPLNTFIFYEYCIGRSSCRILQVQRVDTLYLNCDQTLYYAQTTFMAMEYDCIDESKILTINANKGVSSEPGGSVHLQGHDYLVPSISSTITTSSCSIETPSCDSTISIEVLDLRLASDGSDCKQTVTILYGYRITNFTCVNNINFTRFTVGSEHNYLNVTFSNSMTSNGGHFWLGFRGTRSDVIRIDCPAKLPVTDCNFTTTTEPTTTTEIHTTTELDTTTYEVEMTTTELDTSTTVSDTTSIESLTTNSSPDKNSSQLNTTIIGVAANPTSPPEKTANEDFEENIEISQTDDAVGYEHKLTLRDDFVESIEANSRDMKKTKKKKRKKKKGLDLDDEIIDEENHRKIKKKKKKHGREIDETNDDHNLTTNDI